MDAERFEHVLCAFARIGRERQANMRALLLDLRIKNQAPDIIQQDVGELYGAGDRGTDDVLALVGKARMALQIDKGDFAVRCASKKDSGHLRLDCADRYLRVGLSVALTAAVALLRLHLEDVDFLLLAGLVGSAGNGCTGNIRRANGQALAVANCKHLVKGYSRAVIHAKLFYVDYIAFGYFVLLATGL